MKNRQSVLVFSFIVASVFSAPLQSAFADQKEGTHSEHSSQDTTPAYHKHFKNAKHWAKSFEDPERDKWQMPDTVIKQLGVKPGDLVADLGSGTGYFSIRLAKMYPEAKIIGADIEPDMVAFLKKEAKQRKLPNLTAYKIDANKPKLPNKASIALMVDTFHHIDNRVDYLKNLSSSLVAKGQVALIDFTKASPIGPPAKHRIEPEEVIAQFKEAGYELSKRFDDLPNQYFLLFQKND